MNQAIEYLQSHIFGADLVTIGIAKTAVEIQRLQDVKVIDKQEEEIKRLNRIIDELTNVNAHLN